MPVRFKFREDAKPSERRVVLDRIRKTGCAVRPMFPGDSDPELAGLYRVECTGTAAGKLVQALAKSRTIEFAENELRRKLIR
jgi:hypothetical protein